MSSFSKELQSIIDALHKERLCAVIIDSTGDRPVVELMFGQSLTFTDVDPAVLAALIARGLLPQRIVETLASRGVIPSDGELA